MSELSQNLKQIQSDIKGTNAKIIAVTKYFDETKIIQAYNVGVRDFAESKVQDALNKLKKLPEEIVKSSTWHFIGHLQANKVKKVVGKFDYIHSVDSLKLAKEISKKALELGITQKVLIQVNNADEETKFGFNKQEIKERFKELLELKSLEIVGIMNMAPLTNDTNLLHLLFKDIKELRFQLQTEFNCYLPELSMGMSSDYKIAVEEGSTMIRIGRKLFK